MVIELPGGSALFAREPLFLNPSGRDLYPGSQKIGLAGDRRTIFRGNHFSLFPLVSRMPLAEPSDFPQQFFL